ncbi:MAG: polysaccharide biosynthesis tyrosine autokinase [Thermodesulfobacteriota bacterium]|jgi:capsular exopolysaccharide synthesis family protein
MQELSPYYTTRQPAVPAEPVDSFEEERRGNLHDYVIAVLKYRWTIAIFFLAVVLIAVLAVLIREPVYTATAVIRIQSQAPNVTGVPEALDPSFVDNREVDYYQTQYNLLRSRSLAARVIKELGLENDPRFRSPTNLASWVKDGIRTPLKYSIQWLQGVLPLLSQNGVPATDNLTPETFELGVHPALVDRYLSALAISPVGKSQLMQVKFTSVDAALSKEVANAHAATFIRMSLQTRFELTAEARQFLEEKLKELKAKVEQSEEALNRFRKEHQITSLEKGENLMVERLMGLNRALTEAQARRIDLESLYRVVQQKNNRLLSQVIDNNSVRQLKDQIATLEAEQARLLTKFTPTYPRVAQLQEQIDLAKGRLDQELRRIVRTIESDYLAAKEREDALTMEMAREKQAALDLQEKVVEHTILEREAASNRTLYENVLRRTKETDLAGEVPVSNIQVTDRAERPLEPDSAGGKMTILLSMVVGLLGGAALAVCRHYMDNTVKTPEDVGSFLRLPTLGMVPDVRRLDKRENGMVSANKPRLLQQAAGQQNGNKRELVVSHHPFSIVAESYRTIRTSILFSVAGRPPRTILISSAQPREGKTLTAVNIAISFAQLGEPVLVVDADLRRGLCHRLLGLRNDGGLANVLTGNGNASDFIQQTAVCNLYLLPRGKIPPNPVELLSSERMRETLGSLESKFRFVVIDSAPLVPITDTIFLSTLVDGVILVVRAQEVPRHVAIKARERLSYVKAKVLGVVINGVDLQGPEYTEYRSSYQSYYANPPVTDGDEGWERTGKASSRRHSLLGGQ